MKKNVVTAKKTILTIPTYSRHPSRRLPILFIDGHMNIYPCKKDDVLGGTKRNRDYLALVLENEHLRLTVLPELGGKLWSVYDKNAREEAVLVPDCIKPGLINLAGAWIAGGMEFNFPVGHHPKGMQLVPCAIVENSPERGSIVQTRTCERTGLVMEVRISLAAGEARFRIDYTLSNPTALAQRWYHWTNVGVLAHDQWRFFCKAKRIEPGGSYPIGANGADLSWYKNRPCHGDSFMVAHCEDFFAAYDFRCEHGITHVSPWQQMRGKKYFTWGHTFCDYWDEVIFSDAGRTYVEIQAGPMETQQEFAVMRPGESTRYGETWTPYRQTGGVEWANDSLIFNVRDKTPWLYAAVPLKARIVIGGKVHNLALKAGVPVKLPAKVRKGDRVEIHVNGKLERAFAYPFEGRQDPEGDARIRARNTPAPLTEPKTADDALQRARAAMKFDVRQKALENYRKALALDPALHEARLELADMLWHTGDFDGGEKELRKLAKTPLASVARVALARRKMAETQFYGPIASMLPGPARDLALAEQYAGHGGYEAAGKIYRALLKSDPKNPRVHYGMALYYYLVKADRRKAVRHADRVRALAGADRDYVMELCPIYTWADRHDRVVQIVESAPREVRELSVCRKFLAKSYFELGKFDRAFAVLAAPGIVFNWEGETGHYDVYVDSALRLAELAIRKGNLRDARKWVEKAKSNPPALGVYRRHFNGFGAAYLDGVLAVKEGDPKRARQIWGNALKEWDTELAVMGGAPWWMGRCLTEDIAHMAGMCALALDDKAALEKMLGTFEKIVENQAKLTGKHLDFLAGVIAELRGDYAKAGTLIRKHLQQPGLVDRQAALLHLEAVKAGRRRGE